MYLGGSSESRGALISSRDSAGASAVASARVHAPAVALEHDAPRTKLAAEGTAPKKIKLRDSRLRLYTMLRNSITCLPLCDDAQY